MRRCAPATKPRSRASRAGGSTSPIFSCARPARMKKGELSEPVRTAGGLHVIRALEDPRSEVPAFEKARPQLAAEGGREAREKLVAQLRSSLSVRTHPDRIAQGGGR